ncbi:cell division protein FtsZ [Amaricoccus sp.]|uniref:cell division protein FtsZ n=1 Tax=Amaricoccus sp. TaxID=1872485 RepID=UPI0026261E24|nr:cell division protein FtsZ [Amaricoccus sp.]HRO11542.1 cell division protein FtsZ [Amaricoccus sp.]
MALTLSIPVTQDLSPRITVIGVGGAGGNAVNNMIEKQLEGCEFVVANTDAQALQQNQAGNKLQLGARVTEGLGAGARPEVGAAAAEESIEEIVERLSGCHMCFITAGMGGGTGTGAAPIIAKAAREMGILTVGVVTKPFQFEGSRRMKQAEGGVEELQKHVDTLIIIPNQNLFRLANEKTTFTDAFALADDVLYQGVKGVTDLMVRPGIINLDFADVRSVMNEMGKAMMGTGESSGEDRAVQAAEKAIANPLLDEISLKGAKGVLINITAGPDLTLFELDEAANRIRAEVDPEANIMVGSTLDPEMAGLMRVSVVATGIDAVAKSDAMPMPRRSTEPVAAPAPRAAQQPAARSAAEYRPEPRPELRPELRPDPRTEPRAEPVAASYREPSFADYQSQGGVEQEVAFDEPEAVPQPTGAQRTAPFGQPKGELPRQPGEPSPDALRRLQAAVQNVPKAQPMVRPVAQSREPERQSARLTINSLIHKMTGQVGREQSSARRLEGEPRASQIEPDYEDTERERVDIPAFLRRQAN